MSGVYREPEYGFPADAQWVDFTGLEGTSCYCDDAAAKAIRERCPVVAGHDRVAGLNFIDSGDYHYMTALLTERMAEPFSLVLIDNHPDMQQPAFGAGILSCGGWVRWMLEHQPLLRQVLIVGINPSLCCETEGFEGCVTVVPQGSEDYADAAKKWLGSVQEPVYLSIDKDVLAPEFAATNWDQGTMTLESLLELCSIFKNRIAGVDICGELPAVKGGTSGDYKKNAFANKKLLGFGKELLSLRDKNIAQR